MMTITSTRVSVKIVKGETVELEINKRVKQGDIVQLRSGTCINKSK